MEKIRYSGKNLQWKYYVPVIHSFYWFPCQLSSGKNLPTERAEKKIIPLSLSLFCNASSTNGGSCKLQKRPWQFSAALTKVCPPGVPGPAVALSPSFHQQVWPRSEEVTASWFLFYSSCSSNIFVASSLYYIPLWMKCLEFSNLDIVWCTQILFPLLLITKKFLNIFEPPFFCL